jgi:predicted CxxxxCH...CXXCH cytochrome family protein
VPDTPEGNDAASAASEPVSPQILSASASCHSGSKSTPARKVPDWTDNVPNTPKGNDAASAASEPVSPQILSANVPKKQKFSEQSTSHGAADSFVSLFSVVPPDSEFLRFAFRIPRCGHGLLQKA